MAEEARLKDGRTLKIQVIRTVGPKIRLPLLDLLSHKGPYLDHIQDFFKKGRRGRIEGLEWRFYVGICEGEFVANICLWESQGIAILGHVFTRPQWRRLGIANALFGVGDRDFWDRGGEAVQLNTGFGSAPYYLYARHGYGDVPGRKGSMLKKKQGWDSEKRSFPAKVRATGFKWRHWPSANLLFLS